MSEQPITPRKIHPHTDQKQTRNQKLTVPVANTSGGVRTSRGNEVFCRVVENRNSLQ